MTKATKVTATLIALIPATLLLTACSTTGANIKLDRAAAGDLLPAQADAKAEAVRQDPVAYLRQVAAKCRTLEQYTLRFTRHERRGLFRKMYGPERIACWFRREPFSIHMKWLDDDVKYFESTYVEGRQENKVRFVTRWWAPPLAAPPAINRVALQTPVIWGEAKHPMTDFGFERLLERTLTSLGQAGDDVVVTYEGFLPDTGVHHLRLVYRETLHRVPIQELYIDPATDLPVGTILKYPSGRIDSAYFYDDLNTDVTLTDEDFLLEAERAVPTETASGVDPD